MKLQTRIYGSSEKLEDPVWAAGGVGGVVRSSDIAGLIYEGEAEFLIARGRAAFTLPRLRVARF